MPITSGIKFTNKVDSKPHSSHPSHSHNMTAHTIQEASGGLPAAMGFDELFGQAIDDATMMQSPVAADHNKGTARMVSPPYDQQAAPAAVPVSPCTTDESYALGPVDAPKCITGRFSNIETKYQVDPIVLGSGHHGSVRRCIDRVTGVRYAVKSICKHDRSVKLPGLSREIMLLRNMKHRSIIQLVDVFEDANYVHIVTELCEGGELFDKIVQKASEDNGTPCFEEDEAARIIRQVLESVSYMHQHHVVHRDIKPENILFQTSDPNSPIKIIDFGLSRQHLHGMELPMSTIVGTPYYIAPEVLRKKYDRSCDLWSVGVIAYILLCGYPPFNGGNNHDTHRAVLRGEYRFHASDWQDISVEARDFVRRLLVGDPRKRMTVDQALNHPWFASKGRDAVVSTGCAPVANCAPKPMKTRTMSSILRGRIAKRKERKTMFGI